MGRNNHQMLNKVNKDRKDCPVLLKWVGGKYQLSKKLIPLFPDHDTYIEPFFGGGSVYFRKAKAKYNIVNDINMDLVNLYMCVADKDMFDKVQRCTGGMLSARALYEKAGEMLDTPMEISDIGKDWERASYYMFYMRSAFNATHNAGFAVRKQYAQPWNHRILQVLDACHLKLSGTVVECMDFFDMVEKYKDTPSVFWYLDPPYVVADKEKYYEFNFNPSMHERMLECMITLDREGAKFLISYDDIPWLNEMYDKAGFNIDYIDCVYCASGRKGEEQKKATELIITNYKHDNQEDKQTSLFDG